MKKNILLGALMILLALAAFPGDKVSLSFSAGLLLPADSSFKNVYGKSQFLPEVKAAYQFTPEIYGWAAFAWLSAKGTTPELELPAKSTQTFLALGAGYTGRISEKLSYYGELGLTDGHYREEALELVQSGSKLGFRIGAGLRYRFVEKLFVLLGADYFSVSDTVEEVSFKLGGLKIALGVGITF